MTRIYAQASMSLDGYISGPNVTGFEHLFDWLQSGDVAVPTADPEMTGHMSEVSARHLREVMDLTGCLVVGRSLFDHTKGWGGRHTMGVPVVVLTHSVPEGSEQEAERFTFVTEGGIEAAVETASRLAGDKAVGVNGGEMASQCLNAGLLDELWIELVPVLLGDGVPFFTRLRDAPVLLDGPISTAQGDRVTHLRYRVRKT
jgi:dihydrofolate reductase